MRRTKTLAAVISCGLLVGLASTVFADNKMEGTFTLGKWGWGDDIDVKIWITKSSDGSYSVIRRAEQAGKTSLYSGKGELSSSNWLRVEFMSEQGGAADTIANLGGAAADRQVVANGVYRVQNSGRIYGVFRGQDGSVYEIGRKGASEPAPDLSDPTNGSGGDTTAGDTDGGSTDGSTGDGSADGDAQGAVQVLKPSQGTYLAGQVVALELKPADAELTITGPAEKTAQGIKFTGAGDVTIKAKKGAEESAAVALTAVTAEVTQVEVLDAIRLADAQAPHFSVVNGEPVVTPAAILKDQKLRLKVTLKGDQDLAQDAEVAFEVTANGVRFEQTATVGKGLAQGAAVTIESQAPLSDKVKINALDLAWKIGGQSVQGTTGLRVYTTFAQPRKNISNDPTEPATALHFEKACSWANNASQNVGRGAESIGYNVDNRMRHYVHWNDLGNFKPAVADYPEGAEPPKNYKDLPGGWGISNGERRISSLYYPPLEPDQDYEEYANYRNNFGWWVLDNPDYTGGRCNQQAALVCGILGTLGIQAEILYLERTGRGKRTGRPVRQYFFANDGSSTGSGPWNFHGVALANMADGSQWIYDGSFSSPPNRKNGTREWAENPGGPFLLRWGPWYYQDWQGGTVPENDIPTTFEGIQDPDGQ